MCRDELCFALDGVIIFLVCVIVFFLGLLSCVLNCVVVIKRKQTTVTDILNLHSF